MEASVKLESSTSPAPDWKAAVELLITSARSSSSLLGVLLQERAPGSPTRVLAEQTVGSISRALLVIDAVEKPLIRKTEMFGLSCSDDRRSEVTAGKRKITPVRRVYTRRSHPYSCTEITTKTIDDAYTWRKYGQKPIYNATFPRCYYRCTHKYDRGCQAKRHVQQSEEDPTMFVITYMGEHTCRSDPTRASASGPYLKQFGSDSMPLPKLESDEEAVSSASPLESSLEEELVLPEFWAFNFSEFNFMGDNECGNLDELLNFEHEGLF